MIAELFKVHLRTPLEERVVATGCCPRCHAKTLQEVHAGAGCRFLQCSRCHDVQVVEERGIDGGTS